METVEQFKRVSIKPIVGKELSAKDLVQGYLSDDEYGRMSGQRWYRLLCVDETAINNNDRVFLSISKFYTPTTHDVGKVLLLECAGNRFFHTEPVIPFALPPNPRQMIQVNNSSNAPSFTGPSFTIVTYNVLAEVYATSEQFPNCPSFALSWEYRPQNLLKEILQCDADIICLQEVQQNHFSDFFHPELAKRGYEGLFKEKQRECYISSVDGCATFYRLKQFDLIRCWWINLIEPAQTHSRFHKDNIALNVILSFKSTSQPLCIANTHIHANPNNSDVKLWQVYYMLQDLEMEMETYNYDVPLVICGDFNSLPGSDPHSLLTKQRLCPSLPQGNLILDPYGTLQLYESIYHLLPLASAYSSYSQCDVSQEDIKKKMNDETEEPRFTHFVKNFHGTLDYILYTNTNLKVVSLLELIDEEEVKDAALPSLNRSSDHIPIAASFVTSSVQN